MITRIRYYGVLAPLLVGLLAAIFSLLVVGPGAHGLDCGPSWSMVASGEHLNKPRAIASVAGNDIWVVGSTKKDEAIRTGAEHWDGSDWSRFPTPDVGDGDNALNGVDATASDDVWATGYFVDGTRYKTLTLHYDGTAWSRVPSANGADGASILMGVDASSPTEAWAVGFEYRAKPHHYVASTQRWDGSGWTTSPSAISTDDTQESAKFDVAKSSDTSRVWAVGRSGPRLTLGGLNGVVETICTSASSIAAAPAQGRSGAPTYGSAEQVPEQPSSTLVEDPVSGASAATYSGAPVTAVDKAAEAGISEITRTYGAIVADFDNDTLPDIFLGRHGGQPRLYENADNGTFEETNQGTFARQDRHGCDAADVNGDGLNDIFCTEGANNGTSAKRNELYIQRADHTFAERAARYGVLDPFGRGRSAKFFDANGDTRPDLYVGNKPTRGDGLPSPNRYFSNPRGSAFRYAPAYGLERETALLGSNAIAGDLDEDGWRDLILITTNGLRAYHNEQGRVFTDMTSSVGLGQSAKDVTLADVNGDGWLDVVEVEPDRLSVLVNRNGEFSRAFSASLQYGFSAAAGDVNGDDRPDIYVMRGRDAAGANAPDQVYLNDGEGAGFTRMSSIPSTSEGEADSVAPIDFDGNGLTDFLVLNGGGDEGSLAGPVELIAFFRST